MQTTKLPIAIWKEDNYFIASCPLNSVTSQGKTREEAIANLREALELYFEDEDDLVRTPPYTKVESSELELAL